MNREISLVVNGAAVTAGEGASLGEFIASRGMEPAHVVAEVNGEIVKREQWNEKTLAHNDTIEIVRFVGGG